MKYNKKSCETCINYHGDRKICSDCNMKIKTMYRKLSQRDDSGVWIRSKPIVKENEISKYRIRRGLTIKNLAELLQISESNIKRLLRGEPTSWHMAIKIWILTGIPPIDLVFPTELLKDNGWTRDNMIKGLKHANL